MLEIIGAMALFTQAASREIVAKVDGEENADATAQTGEARRPAPLNASVWFGTYDTPAAALQDPRLKPVRFRLTVAADGTVADCTVIETSRVPEVDADVCHVVQERALFAPARDAAGNPVKGYYVGKIDWNRNPDPRTASFTAIYSFTLRADGTTTDCEVVGLYGEVPPSLMNKNPCTMPRDMAPVRDANGRPVERTIRMTYSTEVIEE